MSENDENVNYVVRTGKRMLKNCVNYIDKVAEMNIVTTLSTCQHLVNRRAGFVKNGGGTGLK